MKCETCTNYLTQFDYECFNGICDQCHEKFVKDESENQYYDRLIKLDEEE